MSPEEQSGSAQAKTLLREQRYGVLSTLQRTHQPGCPLGSLAPFALTPAGEPLFAFSALAEHTKNVLADPRASLFVQAASAEPQAAPRLALLGSVVRSEGEEELLRTRYLAAHPAAARLFELDFSLWFLRIAEGRFIGGFGRALWLPARELVGSTSDPSGGLV
jgi:heme iron utilization protein